MVKDVYVLKLVLYVAIGNDVIKDFVTKGITVNHIIICGGTFSVLSNSVYKVIVKENVKTLDYLWSNLL